MNPPSSSPLQGKVALVTGGASGLGAALCQELAGAGARVLVADLQLARAASLAQRLREDGASAEAISLDVCDPQAAQGAVRAALDTWGALDILINNAGIDLTRPAQAIAPADWQRIIATNLSGPFYLSRCALAPLQEGAGHIVNICSTAAKRGWPNASAYHASKWGLLGLSHALHAELRGRGIKVTAVIAGGMRTPFLLERFPELDPAQLQDPAHVARAVRGVLELPAASVVAELTVLPLQESSWP
ncbi:SDR family oxidoreductase [Massilia sp. TS11]|uniref:SDR family oxidoreductase n=1 Tax=Massilia sp. TS11 TaxID=2908003 RepID=UPI001EDC64D1|nr:SDR family oxidoreductase [Massilia sp. TS11]MCG2586863.1 SDR family oxidoreductase [Massilia sp. TS11]